MNKIFLVEEGNVLMLVMERPDSDYYSKDVEGYVQLESDLRAYNNRESYPYVAEGWKVGDLKELGKDFELRRERQILFHTEKQWYKMSSEEKDACFEYTATPITKPKKED